MASSAPGVRAARHMTPPRRLLTAIALIALIGTGCSNAPAETGSGGGQNPTTTGSPSTELNSNEPAETGGDENAAAKAGSNPERKVRLLELAKCMRENGVEDFPDPTDEGIIEFFGDAKSPEFTSARENCRVVMPEGLGLPREGNGG
jgi:hypothetical protein